MALALGYGKHSAKGDQVLTLGTERMIECDVPHYPSLWKNVVGEKTSLLCVGVTGANEIVFSAFSSSNPFCIFYYNIERKTVTRVEIKGLEAFKGDKIWTFLDHIENVNLMQVL